MPTRASGDVQRLPNLVQQLSDQIWVNRVFCDKSMKLGTDIYHAKPIIFSYSAKPDFSCGGCGSHLKNGRYVSTSPKLSGVESSLSTLYIAFVGRIFQKTYWRIHHAIVSAILEAIFFLNGAHFQSNIPSRVASMTATDISVLMRASQPMINFHPI